ncbi:class I SAM-dependent methyltransferase [Bacillus sp. V5-8f]|uniref:class I SAM-dependent methyltransferase n=1 Tax=Bacillus sp. V5-8f TaxID=2053044 RepID=UPI002155ACDE|nr:class I SAM-dependent methyltransferase [Bacillus sp. V5-8f]
MNIEFRNAILTVGQALEQGGIPYQFTGAAALFMQGVAIKKLNRVEVSIQWDLFQDAFALFSAYSPSEPEKSEERASFCFEAEGIHITVSCLFNTTIKTDPYRISVQLEDGELWCQSLYIFLYGEVMAAYRTEIHDHLLHKQSEFKEQNERAWNQNNYQALINRYGKPEEISDKIKQNPKWRLQPFYKYLGDLPGKKVVHLMGSNGVKGTALALLGAEVKIVDFSQENAAFATELADAAGVSFEYVVSDVLSLPKEHLNGEADIVLMELGVLHYLIDLHPLMEIIKQLLKPGGIFVLHEFHPISTKLITSTGKKHKVTGNYFDPAIESNTVAFSKHMSGEDQQKLANVVQRKWTLGELVTSVGQSGLMIKVLEEEPNHKMHDIGLPKTYTLVAEKPSIYGMSDGC